MKKKVFFIVLLNIALFSFLEVGIFFYQVLQKPLRNGHYDFDLPPPFYGYQFDDCANDRLFDPITHHTLTHSPSERCANPYGYYKNGAFYYEPQKGEKKFLALGGSTTDATVKPYAHFQTWVYHLTQNPAMSSYRVINAGVAGYGSGQELLKFIRDGLPQKADIVVSLNGINENYSLNDWYQFMPLSPHSREDYTTGQIPARLSEKIFMPKLKWGIYQLIHKYVAPPPGTGMADSVLKYVKETNLFYDYSDIPPEEVWFQNVQAMHTLVKGYGGQYFVFVQPTLGLVGTEPEPGSPDDVIFQAMDKTYVNQINEFYKKLISKCERLDYCTNISQLLSGSKDFYYDVRHPNSKGNAILANKIMSVVQGQP